MSTPFHKQTIRSNPNNVVLANQFDEFYRKGDTSFLINGQTGQTTRLDFAPTDYIGEYKSPLYKGQAVEFEFNEETWIKVSGAPRTKTGWQFVSGNSPTTVEKIIIPTPKVLHMTLDLQSGTQQPITASSNVTLVTTCDETPTGFSSLSFTVNRRALWAENATPEPWVSFDGAGFGSSDPLPYTKNSTLNHGAESPIQRGPIVETRLAVTIGPNTTYITGSTVLYNLGYEFRTDGTISGSMGLSVGGNPVTVYNVSQSNVLTTTTFLPYQVAGNGYTSTLGYKYVPTGGDPVNFSFSIIDGAGGGDCKPLTTTTNVYQRIPVQQIEGGGTLYFQVKIASTNIDLSGQSVITGPFDITF